MPNETVTLENENFCIELRYPRHYQGQHVLDVDDREGVLGRQYKIRSQRHQYRTFAGIGSLTRKSDGVKVAFIFISVPVRDDRLNLEEVLQSILLCCGDDPLAVDVGVLADSRYRAGAIDFIAQKIIEQLQLEGLREDLILEEEAVQVVRFQLNLDFQVDEFLRHQQERLGISIPG